MNPVRTQSRRCGPIETLLKFPISNCQLQFRHPIRDTPMAKPFNPFEHHHHHDHGDHDHDHAHNDMLDPGQRSLNDSLRVSFFILKLVMLAMVVIYLCSGIFFVKSGEVAIVLRFGAIVGKTPKEQVMETGKLHFALPYPIDQVIRIPINERQFELREQFWFTKANATQTDDEAAMSAGPLNPETQGSLVTGDANIVHARWVVKYKVNDPVLFATSLANARITDSDKMMAESEKIVRAAAEEGVVFSVAKVSADDMISSKTRDVSTGAQEHLQKVLQNLKSGIQIISLAASETAMPLSVRTAYQQVLNAENESAGIISMANKERAEVLGGTAGEAHEALWELVKQYEIAVEANKKEDIAALEAKFAAAFVSKKVKLPDGREVSISGEVASAISEAEAFQNQIATSARREAQTFVKLKGDYDANPRIFLNRHWENIRERIFTNPDFETFVLPPSQMRLHISRDPKLQKEREKKRQQDLQNQQTGQQR